MVMQYRFSSVVALAALLAVSACSGEQPATATNTDQPIAVQVASATVAGEQTLQFSGQVEATQTAQISTRTMGFITQIYVKVGDKVQAGQLLVSVSNQDMQAKKAQAEAMLAEAEANLKNAQKDYERFGKLAAQGSATDKELDNIQLQLQSAKARVEAAKQMRQEVEAMMAYTRLTAPFTGTITQKMADAGSMASPGMPILTLENSTALQVAAFVPESDIAQLKEGQAVRLAVKSAEVQTDGTITQISASSQATGGQYLVKIAFKQGLAKVYAGMYVQVSAQVQAGKGKQPTGIFVPKTAIVHREQLTGLYTVGAGKTALLRWVRLGKETGDLVEVLSGLDANEQFITQPQSSLYNGAPVNIQ